MEEHLLSSPVGESKQRASSPRPSSNSFGFPKAEEYDEEKRGNYLKYLLNNQYKVRESIILGKIYQVAPWKTGRYIWKSQRTLFFQVKIICHIALIILLSFLVLFINNQYGSYQRGMSMLSCGFFLPKERCSYSDCVGSLSNQANSLEDYSCSLYKKGEVLTAIQDAVDQYYRINETSIGLFQIPICDDSDPNSKSSGACAKSYGLQDCQPNDHLESASLKLYKYNSNTVNSIPLSSIYHQNESFYRSFTKKNFTELRLMELHLPILDTFITDNYHAIYQWNIIIKYEFETKVKFDISVEQQVKRICNIDSSTSSLFQIQTMFSSSQKNDDQVNNVNSEYISLASLQGWMNSLSIVIIILSFISFIVLFYETIQNLRLVLFTADVLSYNPFLKSNYEPRVSTASISSLKSSSKATKQSLQSNSWKEWILSCISFFIRYLLRIPARYYLNDFPRLYSMISTHIEATASGDKKNEPPSDSSSLIDENHYDQQGVGGKVERTSMSFNEMKEFYHLTSEIYRFAPDDLYTIPPNDRLSNLYDKNERENLAIDEEPEEEQVLLQERRRQRTSKNTEAKPDASTLPENTISTSDSSNLIHDQVNDPSPHTLNDRGYEQKEHDNQSTEKSPLPGVIVSERSSKGSLENNESEEKRSADKYSEESRETDEERERILKLEQIRDLQRKSLQMWKKLSIKVKMRLLDGWRLLSFFTTILTIYALVTFLTVSKGYYLLTSLDNNHTYHSSTDTNDQTEADNSSFGNDLIPLILGLSLFLQYFTLLNYLRYNNRFTTSTIILWSAFFKVQRIIISILPLAFGLMLLGVIIFGNSSNSFGSIKAIFVTIFSVMNCDSIWDTFNDTNSTENIQIIGTVYVTLIFIIFSYLMLRLILAVVESLYFYFRLYSSLRRKRLLFRKKHLIDFSSTNTTARSTSNSQSKIYQNPGQSQSRMSRWLSVFGWSKIPSLKVRTHNSDLITKSLFTIYTNDLVNRTSPSPSNSPSSSTQDQQGLNQPVSNNANATT